MLILLLVSIAFAKDCGLYTIEVKQLEKVDGKIKIEYIKHPVLNQSGECLSAIMNYETKHNKK